MIDRLLTPMLVPMIGSPSIPRSDAVEATRSFDAWLQESASEELVESESPMPLIEQGDQAIEQWVVVEQATISRDRRTPNELVLPEEPADPTRIAPGYGDFLPPQIAVDATLVRVVAGDDSPPVSRDDSISIARPIEDRDTQFVSVPWRLMAGKGLSYLGAGLAGEVATLVAPQGPSVVPTDTRSRVEDGPSRAPGHPPSQQWLRADEDRENVRNVVATAESMTEANPFDPLSRAGSDWTRTSVWLQRLLRWQGDAEETTAWVRDFQMDPKAASSLVDSLQLLAREQNLTLRRIVLNGHEIWRSPIQRRPSGSK